jgi:electron-transferring-flavoprotein dehydrogenase
LRPADYPPPFDPVEFVAAPGEPEIEVGVLIVGAGPAGLACAIRLGQLLEGAPELAERLGDVPVAVLEKGRQPGSHLLSGAVVNPRCASCSTAATTPATSPSTGASSTSRSTS